MTDVCGAQRSGPQTKGCPRGTEQRTTTGGSHVPHRTSTWHGRGAARRPLARVSADSFSRRSTAPTAAMASLTHKVLRAHRGAAHGLVVATAGCTRHPEHGLRCAFRLPRLSHPSPSVRYRPASLLFPRRSRRTTWRGRQGNFGARQRKTHTAHYLHQHVAPRDGDAKPLDPPPHTQKKNTS